MHLDYDIDTLNSSGIYALCSTVDDRKYIGSTSCFRKRKNNHFAFLKKGKHPNARLQEFVNTYGIASLQFKIIEITENLTKADLEKLEKTYLWNHKSFMIDKGFNILDMVHGIHFNKTLSEEHKKNIGKSSLGRTPNKGKRLSEEWKEKMSLSHKKRYEQMSVESLSKMGELISKRMVGNKNAVGTKQSKETIAKREAAKKLTFERKKLAQQNISCQ